MGLCCACKNANTPPSTAKVDETDELKQSVETPNDDGSTKGGDDANDEAFAHESPSDGYVKREWIFDTSGRPTATNREDSTEIVYDKNDDDLNSPDTESKEPEVVYESDRARRSVTDSDAESVHSVSSYSSAVSGVSSPVSSVVSTQSVPVHSPRSKARNSYRKRPPRARSRPPSAKHSEMKSKSKKVRKPRSKSRPLRKEMIQSKDKEEFQKRHSTHHELGNMVRYSLDVEHDEQWLYAELAHINGRDIMGLAEDIRKKNFIKYIKNTIDLEGEVAKKLWKDIDRDRDGIITVKQFEKWKKRHGKPTALRHLFK